MKGIRQILSIQGMLGLVLSLRKSLQTFFFHKNSVDFTDFCPSMRRLWQFAKGLFLWLQGDKTLRQVCSAEWENYQKLWLSATVCPANSLCNNMPESLKWDHSSSLDSILQISKIISELFQQLCGLVDIFINPYLLFVHNVPVRTPHLLVGLTEWWWTHSRLFVTDSKHLMNLLSSVPSSKNAEAQGNDSLKVP